MIDISLPLFVQPKEFIDSLLTMSLKATVADIHFEYQSKEDVCVRISSPAGLSSCGFLNEVSYTTLINYIKVLARMRVSDARLPQDGHFVWRVKDTDFNVRVSTMPTIYGENIVLRLLDPKQVMFPLEQIISPLKMSLITSFLHSSQGLILVTGPTGSGKTTTLYSMLNYIRSQNLKIITIEDPVEYEISTIVQVNTDENIGLSFSSLLRHVLRHDPDIIFIGEIRDKITLSLAMESSLTGHLVLSSFHANDSLSTLFRLMNMGIESYLICASLQHILAQRLVRRLCEACRYQRALSSIERNFFPDEYHKRIFYDSYGCLKCSHTGYQGVLVVIEHCLLSISFLDFLATSPTLSSLRVFAKNNGFKSLFDEAIEKALLGLISPQEIIKEIKITSIEQENI